MEGKRNNCESRTEITKCLKFAFEILLLFLFSLMFFNGVLPGFHQDIHIAELYIQVHDDYQTALKYALMELHNYPSDSDNHFFLARIYYQLGNGGESYHHLKETLKLNPKHAGAIQALKQFHYEDR